MSRELNRKQIDERAVAQQGGWIDRQVHAARARMHLRFLAETRPDPATTVLDVGASAEPALNASNYLEWASPDLKITACGLGHANALWSGLYPGIPYVHGSALKLPFEDNSFDIVYSHAVIEHVGSFDQQCQMLTEALRVARRSVWVTTPDRFHPLEFHTALPLLHWLPKPWHRSLLSRMGLKDFASEQALNLMDRASLLQAASTACARRSDKPSKIHLHTSRFLGCSANLLLHLEAQPAGIGNNRSAAG